MRISGPGFEPVRRGRARRFVAAGGYPHHPRLINRERRGRSTSTRGCLNRSLSPA